MSRTLSVSNVLLSIDFVYKNAMTDGTVAEHDSSFSITDSLATGTSADQSDRLWYSLGRTLASGYSEAIDLYDLGSIDIGAGAGKDILGQTLAFAEITALAVWNKSVSGNLKVGGQGDSTAFQSIFDNDVDAKLIVKAGGFGILYAPSDPAYAVVDATNHVLKMQASGGAVTYDIFVIGRSA